MNESAILAIQKYIDECLFEPGWNWPKYYFDERAYSRWAANEIIRRLKERASTTPVTVIEEFISTMDYFSYVNEDTIPSLIFVIAHDIAKDILCLFL